MVPLQLAGWLLLPWAVAAQQIKDLNITDLVLCDGKGGGGKAAPTIIWSPSIVVSKQNTTLAVAQAQWKQGRTLVKAEGIISRSVDAGISFSPDHIALPAHSPSHHHILRSSTFSIWLVLYLGRIHDKTFIRVMA